MKTSNGPVELGNVRITLGQFAAMMLAVSGLIAICAVGVYRLTLMESKMDTMNARVALVMDAQDDQTTALNTISQRVKNLEVKKRK